MFKFGFLANFPFPSPAVGIPKQSEAELKASSEAERGLLTMPPDAALTSTNNKDVGVQESQKEVS